MTTHNLTGSARRTASIARSISWSFWWRKLITWLTVNVIIVAFLASLFTWQCARELPAAALDGITTRFLYASVVRFGNWGIEHKDEAWESWEYFINGADGITYRFPISPFLRMVMPFGIVVGVVEIIDLVSSISDTRRVRRRLQPLNDLAIAAEAAGSATARDPRMANDADKMATLEAAIARASVDAPKVTTGDSDLASIEVALNGLLRQMQEAKLQQMRFVSDASHELRTPIAVIQGYVGLLDRWGKTDEAIRDEAIEALKSESKHMQELIEQLLFLARGDSGNNTLQRERLNLADLVREVCEESCLIDADHRYSCNVDEGDASSSSFDIIGDLAMIKQSMRIIVENAAKYSPIGSTIRLEASTSSNTVSYSVTDEGIGMSSKEVAHIFDRFYRAEGGRANQVAGTGLGLSIAKWIVDAHGGSISVLSHEDIGTRFVVSLPQKVDS